jgi:outer membrane protein TolC
MRDLDAARDQIELARMDLQQAQHDYQAGTVQPRELTPKSSRAAGPREVTPESLDALRLEIQAMDARLARAKQMVEAGTLPTADYLQLQTEYQKLILQYQQQQKQRDSALALNERLVKSLEDEIALVKERIAAIEKRVAAGTVPSDNPELLQLRRDLLGLQRNLDQARVSIKR